MNNLILDIQHGASGEMLTSALVDLGMDLRLLKKKLKDLCIPSLEVTSEKISVPGINGSRIEFKLREITGPGEIKTSDIINSIQESSLEAFFKEQVTRIFKVIIAAEAKVQDTTSEKVHIFEEFPLRSIVEIASFCLCVDNLNINKIFFTDFHPGSGPTNACDGFNSSSTASTTEIIKNYRAVTVNEDISLLTPTAAAILTEMGSQLERPISYTLVNQGTGFEKGTPRFPLYTKALLIKADTPVEEITQLECNIDDMNPQLYPYVIEKLFSTGALDAYITPIIMKKGRTGTEITIIAPDEKIDSIKELLYRETTTLGVRISKISREKLNRDYDEIKLHNQKIKIKLGYLNGEIVNIQPEFEDCKKAAETTGKPLNEIIRMAREEYNKKS